MFWRGIVALAVLFACQPKAEQGECLPLAEWQQTLDSLSTPSLEQVSMAIQKKDSLALEQGIASMQGVIEQVQRLARTAGCVQPDSLRVVLDLQVKSCDSLGKYWLPGLRPLLKVNLSVEEKEKLSQSLEAMQLAALRQRARGELLLLQGN